ncbi:hypothetical protein HDA32_003169 [Spinactinospora alkalitolerans]|uniref:Uncharacterized protein n=1 Tax=Spinactinospora alkalitolerans TaxID=687207 RepID=A0A852TVK1_9ACTN|nr:hypothetical protein [Spinactinospora alkalitolerans]
MTERTTKNPVRLPPVNLGLLTVVERMCSACARKFRTRPAYGGTHRQQNTHTDGQNGTKHHEDPLDTTPGGDF